MRLATPNLLLYGLVGWSWGSVDHDFKIDCDSCDSPLIRVGDDFDANGFTFGGGAEYKVWENISIRGEYRFIDFDNFDDNRICEECGLSLKSDAEVDVQQLLFTLNWRFGDFGTPAAAY